MYQKIINLTKKKINNINQTNKKLFKTFIKIYSFPILLLFIILNTLILYFYNFLLINYFASFIIYNFFNKILFFLSNEIIKKYFLDYINKKYNINHSEYNNNSIIHIFFVIGRNINRYFFYLISLFSTIIYSFFDYKFINILLNHFKYYAIISMFLIILNYFLDIISSHINKIDINLGYSFDNLLNDLKINDELNKKKYLKEINRLDFKETIFKLLFMLVKFISDIILIFLKIDNKYLNNTFFNLHIYYNLDNIIKLFIFNKRIISYIEYINRVIFQIKSNDIKNNDNIDEDYNSLLLKKKIIYTSLTDTNYYKRIYHNNKTELHIFKKKNNDNKDILISFNNAYILDNKKINFNIIEQDIIIIDGPTGSGKTSLIKYILNNNNNSLIKNNIKFENIFYIPNNFGYHYFNDFNIQYLYAFFKRNKRNNEMINIIKDIDFNFINYIFNRKINLNFLSEGEKRKLLLLQYFLSNDIKILLLDDVFDFIRADVFLKNKLKRKILEKNVTFKHAIITTNFNDILIL